MCPQSKLFFSSLERNNDSTNSLFSLERNSDSANISPNPTQVKALCLVKHEKQLYPLLY